MTHKLLSNKNWNLTIQTGENSFSVRIRDFSFGTMNRFWIGRHEDLNEALQEAILQMLGKEK